VPRFSWAAQYPSLNGHDIGYVRSALTGTLRPPPPEVAARLLARDGYTPPLTRLTALITSYIGVFGKLAAHAPVITIDTTTDAA
jgi:hypothetical protein